MRRNFLFKNLELLILSIFSFVIFFNFPIPKTAYAASCSSNATGDWDVNSTWTSCGGGVPQAGDTVTIGAHTVTIPSSLTINQVTNITIQSGGTLTQGNTNTQIITGTLTINSGGILNHTTNTSLHSYEVDFSAANITIDTGGKIDVDGRGYSGGNGVAGAKGGSHADGAGGGGANGGNGGTAQIWSGNQGAGGTANCDITNPATLGSGGNGRNFATAGTGSDGGGLVKLNVTGTLTVNGVITADGTAGSATNGGYTDGGGAGGAVNITTSTIAGTPEGITLTGGASYDHVADGGGGGGGCMLLVYTTDSASSGILNASSITVNGGAGNGGTTGGAGVILIKKPSTDGDFFVKNSVAGAYSNQTASSLTVDTATVTGSAIYSVPTTKTFALDTSTALTAGDDTGRIVIDDGAILTPPTTFTLDDTTLEFHQSATWTNSSSTALTLGTDGILDFRDFTTSTTITFSTVTVQSTGKITHGANTTAQSHIVNMTATTFTIDAGGSIDVDAKGYSANNGETGGKGAGNNCAGGGGANGGNGGASETSGACTSSGGTAYGDSGNPALIGSGGGTRSGTAATSGSQGGGLIKLNITGTLTINGTITADGATGTGSNGGYGFGGGGGGGINIATTTIAGTPQSITATGGGTSNEAVDGGGGGGGRVYFGYTSSTSIGTDNVTVTGGAVTSAVAGSAGSKTFTQTNNAPTSTVPGSISQAANATGNITFSITVADADGNTNTVKVEISDNGGGSWFDAFISSVVGSVGTPTVDNDQVYQLRSVATSSSNTLTVVWASQSASNGNGGIDNTDQSDIQVRVTANDGITNGTTQTSASFAVDNLDPSGLGSFAVSSETTTTTTLGWAAVTEANFNHYEIWYGTTQANVQTRSGATEWDNSDDATLATRTTVATTITGLSVNTQYYYKIWAVDNFGNEVTVADITAFTSANTPAAPTLSAASSTSLNVIIGQNSNPATTTYAIPIGSNFVQANGSLGASAVWQTYTNWGGASGVAVTGLTANTQYAVAVKARNGDNDETATASASKYTLASAVSVSSVTNSTTASTFALQLAWTNNGQSGMKIEKDTACDSSYDSTLYDNAAVNATSEYSISSGLAANTCYAFKISSYNGDGVINTASVATSSQITTPLSAPATIASDNVTTTSFTITWGAVSGATSYSIYDASTNASLGSTDGTSYPFARQSDDTIYSYYIRSFNTNGLGIGSSTVSVRTLAASSGSGGGGSGSSSSNARTEERNKNAEQDKKAEEKKVEIVTEDEREIIDEGDEENQDTETEERTTATSADLEDKKAKTKTPVLLEENGEPTPEPEIEEEHEVGTDTNSEELGIEVNEMALLERGTVSFSDTVSSISAKNSIPREFIDFAVKKRQIAGSVLEKNPVKQQKVLSENARKIERILYEDFENLSEKEKKEILIIVRSGIKNEVKEVLKEDKAVRLYLGNNKYVAVKNEEELEEVTEEIAEKLVTDGTDLHRDGLDDRIQLSLDLPLLDSDSDDDGVDVANELSFGLDLYGKDVVSELPQIYVHAQGNGGSAKSGRSPIVKLFGGKKGSKVKVSLVSKKDSEKQVYLGEIVIDDEFKGAITGRDVEPGEYYVVALSADGISELDELEVVDDAAAEAPEIEFEKEKFVKKALKSFPKFLKVFIKKVLIEMLAEVKPRLLEGKAAPKAMIFVTWKSVTLSSVVIADATQGAFQVEIPEEIEDGDHEAIVYVFDAKKSLLSNVSSLFFKWY